MPKKKKRVSVPIEELLPFLVRGNEFMGERSTLPAWAEQHPANLPFPMSPLEPTDRPIGREEAGALPLPAEGIQTAPAGLPQLDIEGYLDAILGPEPQEPQDAPQAPAEKPKGVDLDRLFGNVANAFAMNAKQQPIFLTEPQRESLRLQEEDIEARRPYYEGLGRRARYRSTRERVREAVAIAAAKDALGLGGTGSRAGRSAKTPAAFSRATDDMALPGEFRNDRSLTFIGSQADAGFRRPITRVDENGFAVIPKSRNRGDALAKFYMPYVEDTLDYISSNRDIDPATRRLAEQIGQDWGKMSQKQKADAAVALAGVIDQARGLSGHRVEGEAVPEFFQPAKREEKLSSLFRRIVIGPPLITVPGVGYIPNPWYRPEFLFENRP